MRVSLFQNEKIESTLYLLLRIGLGLVFVYASLDKIWYPGLFAKSIANFKILPLPFLHAAAIILPWMEFLTGLALILDRYPRAANLIIGLLTGIFTMAIISAMLRGLNFNCGCFNLDSTEANIGILKVLENLLLLGVSVLLEMRFRKALHLKS
ncbi:MAG: DoxX family membrane protein [Candidatus Marinimicrobia bacterium]|nr:DoxX family membrane protein [Candidatus Neomarinimicrobiota bacterium]